MKQLFIISNNILCHKGCSHNEEKAEVSTSKIMEGVFLHVMADTLGSVGVIISAGLIHQFGKKIYIFNGFPASKLSFLKKSFSRFKPAPSNPLLCCHCASPNSIFSSKYESSIVATVGLHFPVRLRTVSFLS